MLLISNKEKEGAQKTLEQAFVDDKISSKELEHRLEIIYNAKTHSELEEALLGLLHPRGQVSHPSLLAKLHPTLAIFGGIEQKGPITLSSKHEVVAVFGGCVLDLREAVFDAPVCELEAVAVFGGIQIFVPPHVRVEVQGTPILGGVSHKSKTPNTHIQSPVLRVMATAVLGGIEIVG